MTTDTTITTITTETPIIKVLILQTDNRKDVDYLGLSKMINQKTVDFLNEINQDNIQYTHHFHLMKKEQFQNIHPATGKINVMDDFLNHSEEDIIVFLDSDAWVQNCYHLHDLILYLINHPEKQGCFSRDPYLSRNDYINSGSFILRVNDYNRNMYKEIIREFQENPTYYNSWSYDQHYISKVVHNMKNDFFIFIPFIINTPEGQILRHHWWKTQSMFEDLYHLNNLLENKHLYTKPVTPYPIEDHFDNKPYPNPNTYDYEYKR
jgi:hypothetical protein